MQKTHKSMLLGATLILIGQGCGSLGLSGSQSQPQVIDGGLFVTESAGAQWEQRAVLPSANGTIGSIASVSVKSFAMDPSDRKALYLGTMGHGILYSYNQGRTWNQSPDMRTGTINAIAIDRNDKCTIYLAKVNKVYKSEDCNRTYQEVYIDTKPDTIVQAIEIHPQDSARILVGTSKGDIMQTNNAGHTWSRLNSHDRPVTQIMYEPRNETVVYALVQGQGIHKSADQGQTWINITPDNRTYAGATQMTLMTWDHKKGLLYTVSRHGILRSHNSGLEWESLRLLTEPGQASITALAINPNNANQILYATRDSSQTTLYGTSDAGDTWGASPSPTTKVISHLTFDPDASHIIYATALATQ